MVVCGPTKCTRALQAVELAFGRSPGSKFAPDAGVIFRKPYLQSSLLNKDKRSAIHSKLKREKKVEKRRRIKARDDVEKKALMLGEEPLARKIPRTIENTREADETVCRPDDGELFADNDADEFSSILNRQRVLKTLITTSRFNSTEKRKRLGTKEDRQIINSGNRRKVVYTAISSTGVFNFGVT